MNPKNPYRRNSIRAHIAEHYLAGSITGACWHAVKDRIGEPPFVFSENQNGRRVPLPHSRQRRAMWRTIERTYAEMRANGLPFGDNEHPAPLPEVPKVPEKPEKPKDIREQFLMEVNRLRKFARDRKVGGQPLDDLETMRPVVYGKAMLANGLPLDACLQAIVLHWPQDIRKEANVKPFDVLTFGEPIEGAHRAMPYALKLIEARVPVMAKGGKGIGKSVIAKQAAKHLELPYAECPMTAGATPGWLGGSWTIQKFIDRGFLRLYSGGGIFNFEEIDASDPNMLLFVNNALANDAFENPINGEVYERHPDFVPFATANTWGLGANREYTGRERLDGSSMDRFRMGRIEVALDSDLERSILFG